jgi:MraZ protein
MATFIGEYTVKIDDKGRILFPSALKKQFPEGGANVFVIKRDIYEKCLVLFTMDEWQIELIRNNVNPYKKEHNAFLRSFYKGAAELELDNTGRLLIPKRLLIEVEIDKEAILAGQDNKIELWAKNIYDKPSDAYDFGELAERIMGGNINKS